MATLRVPEVVPSPSEDAEQLRKAFEGSQFNRTSCPIHVFASDSDSDYLCDCRC